MKTRCERFCVTADVIRMTESSVHPFACTLKESAALRSIIDARLGHVLGCDQMSKTVTSLQALGCHASHLQFFAQCCMTSAAHTCLQAIEVLGFGDAARVLKGANPAIASKQRFLVSAMQQFYAVKTAFAKETLALTAHGDAATDESE